MRRVVVSADLVIPLVYEVTIPDDGDVETLSEEALRSVASSSLLRCANNEEMEIRTFRVEDIVP